MAKVFIGVDRHKLSATIEVVDEHETVLATGRINTDQSGHAAMYVLDVPAKLSARARLTDATTDSASP